MSASYRYRFPEADEPPPGPATGKEAWYDRHLRLWTAIWRDDRGNQIGDADYAMSKAQALANLGDSPRRV